MIRLFSLLAVLSMPVAAMAQSGGTIPILAGPSKEAQQIAVTVDRGLRNSRGLRSARLAQARLDMQQGVQIRVEDLRALAQAGDGLAAQRYVRVLLAEGEAAADPSDVAFFAATAVGTGRIWTLKPMIAAMRKLNPETEPKERVRKYIKVLYPYAWAGNALALDALVEFNGEGRLFGPLSEATRQRILDEARAQGDGRIELTLAMRILEREHASTSQDPEQMAQARDYLARAQGSSHLVIRTTAENLLRLIQGS